MFISERHVLRLDGDSEAPAKVYAHSGLYFQSFACEYLNARKRRTTGGIQSTKLSIKSRLIRGSVSTKIERGGTRGGHGIRYRRATA